jgi:hypothetical protein
MAYFNLSGKTPVHSITLQIYVSGEIMNGMLDLIILLVNASYPLSQVTAGFLQYLHFYHYFLVSAISQNQVHLKQNGSYEMVCLF